MPPSWLTAAGSSEMPGGGFIGAPKKPRNVGIMWVKQFHIPKITINGWYKLSKIG
jgi:hypothetical protein